MSCSDAAHYTVWSAFHRNPFNEIYIPRKALEEVVVCHRAFHPDYDFTKIPSRSVQKTAKEIPCDRQNLFKFLCAHDRCRCDVLKPDRAA